MFIPRDLIAYGSNMWQAHAECWAVWRLARDGGWLKDFERAIMDIGLELVGG